MHVEAFLINEKRALCAKDMWVTRLTPYKSLAKQGMAQGACGPVALGLSVAKSVHNGFISSIWAENLYFSSSDNGSC